ncbi:hypothetical protein B0T22DRAFT_236188 [Podospora appendiculata]|uniref:PH domain-containing protein n=1 Tax=Podospora appendiculata TaxID=314037 RepID=A0AAE1CAX6_9PEZI|nr:hypothetical protein B0T22DRAFT_236188 [Podospora appendiculata]
MSAVRTLPPATSTVSSGKVSRYYNLGGESMLRSQTAEVDSVVLPHQMRPQGAAVVDIFDFDFNSNSPSTASISPPPPQLSVPPAPLSVAEVESPIIKLASGGFSGRRPNALVPPLPLAQRDLNARSQRNNDDVNKPGSRMAMLNSPTHQPTPTHDRFAAGPAYGHEHEHGHEHELAYDHDHDEPYYPEPELGYGQGPEDRDENGNLHPHQGLNTSHFPVPPSPTLTTNNTTAAAAAASSSSTTTAISQSNRHPLVPALAPVAISVDPDADADADADTAVQASSIGLDGASLQRELDQAQKKDREDQLAWEASERRQREEEEAALWADEVARLEAETDRILAEQRKKDMVRLQLQAAPPPSPSFSSLKPKSPVLGKMPFLNRGRKTHASALSPTSSISLHSPISPSSSIAASVDLGQMGNLDSGSGSRNFIGVGGKGIVPQTDAPRSASNFADRRVIVRCRGAIVELDVKGETSTVDILLAFAEQADYPINVNASMVSEVYGQLGLERRLRRYERVRDILNSWDQDTENQLVISPDAVHEGDQDLDLASVPREDHEPGGFVLPLYHSHHPGKWNKRFITLLEGGQIFASKKPDPTPADKDVLSLCHLCDFDIYMPTELQMKKHLKPPKKYCFAIKSQQKTTVFLNQENFVHFFCTEDPNVAQKFHSLIHSWRSWYMVNKVLQLHTKRKAREAEKPPQIDLPLPHKPKKSISHVKINGHKVKVSVDESPYAIGAFEPLIDLNRFDKPLDKFGEDWELDAARLSAMPPVPALPLINASKPAPFAAGGLLGDGYEERKQAQKEENKQKQGSQDSADGSFTEGSTLLNGDATASTDESSKPDTPEKEEEKPKPSSWFPSALEHSAKQASVRPPPPPPAPILRPNTSSGASSQYDRRPQRRGPGQPLVNLSPTFVEPQQWSRDGRGRGVKAPEGMMLVDFATGPQAGPGGASRFLSVPPRGLVRRDGRDPNQQHQPRRPSVSSHQQPNMPYYHQQPQRPSTSDGRPPPPRRPTISGPSRRGDGSDMPPLPPVPMPLSLPNRGPPPHRDGSVRDAGGFPMPPPRQRERRTSTSTSHSGGGQSFSGRSFSDYPVPPQGLNSPRSPTGPVSPMSPNFPDHGGYGGHGGGYAGRDPRDMRDPRAVPRGGDLPMPPRIPGDNRGRSGSVF